MYTWACLAATAGLLAGRAEAQRPPAPTPLGPPREVESPARDATAGAARLTRADLEAWLDGFLPYALQRGDIAGAVVVVVRDGEILLSKGYGYRDVAARAPVDPKRTLFRPGSVSKLFTWTAAMQLVEQGKLDLDRDVNQYLDFAIPPAFGRPITLRDLMTHTPGFEEVDKNIFSDDSTGPQPLEPFLKAWTPKRIFPPGRVPAYSNYGNALTGYIVQRVSGEAFDDYIERHIFAPLGMEHASFRQPLPARLKPDMSKGYQVASSPPKYYEMVAPAPAGSLAAAGEDMGRFMIAHLQDGRYGNSRILKPETARLMHGTALTILPQVNRMVLGFYETNRNGRRVIAHGGDTYWFHSDLHLFLDDSVGLFLSMNSGGKDDATSAIRTALFAQFADRYFPGPTADGRVDSTTAAAHARLISGYYDSSRRSASNFMSVLGLIQPNKASVNDDGTISVSYLDQLNGEPKRWREIAPFRWREVNGKNWLAANVEGGKVAMFSGDEISPFIVFLPAPWWRSPGWLLPLFKAAALVLLLTVLVWPAAAIVRRRYRRPASLSPRSAAAGRRARIGAAASLAVLVAWGLTFSKMESDLSFLSSRIDPWIWVLRLATLVILAGAALAALWNCWTVWTGKAEAKRGWFARGWNLVLGVACLTVLWMAITYKLIGLGAHY